MTVKITVKSDDKRAFRRAVFNATSNNFGYSIISLCISINRDKKINTKTYSGFSSFGFRLRLRIHRKSSKP